MARTIKMVSDIGTTMMEVEGVERVADRLRVTGVMMGNFPAEFYLEPADLLAMIALHLRPSPLGFVLGLPYFYLRSLWRREECRSPAARARALGTAALLALGWLAAGLIGIVGIAHVLRLAWRALA